MITWATDGDDDDDDDDPDDAAGRNAAAAAAAVPTGPRLRECSEDCNYFKPYFFPEKGLGFCGGSECLVSSVADYFRFGSMLLNYGVCPSTWKRALSEGAVRQMTSNQVPGGGDLSGLPSQRGETLPTLFMGLKRSGFGLGVSVALRPSNEKGKPHNNLGSGVGEYGWGGAANTQYWASPKDGDLLVLFFTQVLTDPEFQRGSQALRRLVYGSFLEPQ